MDNVLDVMLKIKNNWSLTGDFTGSNMVFGTRFYDKNIMFPQVIVSSLGGAGSPPIDLGSSNATYPIGQTIGFDIWVRPKQNSASSLGWAKNAIYQIRKEVERLLRSGSRIATGSATVDDTFLALISWSRRDDFTKRPPIFHLVGRTIVSKYIKES